MTWVGVRYDATLGTAVAGAGTGPIVVPLDNDKPGTNAYDDLFVNTFNTDYLTRGYDFDTALMASKNSLIGYAGSVQLMGVRQDEQGARSFYAWSNISVGKITVGSTIHDGNVDVGPGQGPLLSYTISFPDQALYYTGHQTFYWQDHDLGAPIWSEAPDIFNFNAADYRQYLSNQRLFDAKGGDDIIRLPDSAEAARVWDYTKVIADVDPGGYPYMPVNGGTGNDTIYGGQFIDKIYGDAGDDHLFGAGGADALDGGVGNDVLDGGTGNDFLSGGDGNDRLIGGPGADVFIGGDGYDIADYSAESGPITLNLLSPGLNAGNAAGDSLYGIEEVVGTSYADTLIGDGTDNVLRGGAGADQIVGLDGNDIIFGGADTDVLYGGAGDDQLSGNDGNDVVFGDDTNGPAGNDAIDGGDGDDQLFGGGGSDTIYGGIGNDQILGQDGNDTLVGGTGGDLITGDDGNDSIDGGDGNDVVYGGAGSDNITGGEGADQLSGNAGTDTIYGGIGGDHINGGVDGDQLSGDAGDDLIYGDDPSGPFGNDLIDGGDGADTLLGFGGDDVLYGGTGGDSLNGGNGNDTLQGQAGNDFLVGGAGADTFLYTARGFNVDQIYDFTPGSDHLSFSTSIFANAGQTLAASTQIGNDVLINAGGGDQIALKNVQLSSLSANSFTFV